MGKVQGNVECADRLDIRSEGVLAGDVITHRISVEEGAILKGGVEVRTPEKKAQPQQQAKQEAPKPEPPKAMAATAGSQSSEFRSSIRDQFRAAETTVPLLFLMDTCCELRAASLRPKVLFFRFEIQ